MTFVQATLLFVIGSAVNAQSPGQQPSSSNDKEKATRTGEEPPRSDKDKKDGAKPLPASQEPANPPASMDLNAYRIGIDDELQISVWKEPDLSSVVSVRSDGMITLPLLNDVRVAGLSTKELQTLLEDKFKAFVNEPQVTIIPRAQKSRRVYLIGSVAKQGQFPLTGNMTVLQLLSEAGGLGVFAKTGSIHILRNVNGRQVRIPFNYKKAIRGETGKNEDVALMPGDMVVVP